jgi:carboxypeptidase Q
MKIQYSLIFALVISTFGFSQTNMDAEAMEKIKNEGLNNSQVESIAFHLIDESGPRLTNSEGYARAANYAVKQLIEWGLTNSTTENWGEFGRGWEMKKTYVAMTKPYYMPFIAVPKAWTMGTGGEVSGKVLFLDIESEEDFEKYRGTLKGAIIAIKPSGTQDPTFEADALRHTKKELKEMKGASSRGRRWTKEQIAEWRAKRAFRGKIASFLAEEGAALIIKGTNGRHGTLFTSSPNGYLKDTIDGLSEIEMAPEFVNMMNRLIENGVSVEIEAEIETTFNEKDLEGYNVIAEIEGSDEQLKSEVVMLGGHLDSWHGATGATDNAAGCIVMMEAVRILKATGLTPRRTVRIALWGGEEQGLHGSKNYVKNHFGDSKTMELKPEQENISAYYNIDNGTGRIRGIYLQGNEAVGPIFKKWFKPFDDIIDNATVTIRDTGGTDHLSFDSIGIPGFQFIQDPIEYWSRTHHTNMDTYERLVIDDLKQMAVIVAAFVYNTAQLDDKLPREELKKVEK